ncbi:hypothetical protein FOMG_19027, partial [Fusarium oxysporum f. sp. melonis 26406]
SISTDISIVQDIDTFQTDHGLKNAWKIISEAPLKGLSEAQTENPVKKDRYQSGATTRWRLIWYTVLLDSVQPGSPYGDGGKGLKNSV